MCARTNRMWRDRKRKCIIFGKGVHVRIPIKIERKKSVRGSGLETFASSWSIAASVVCWLFLFKLVFDEDRYSIWPMWMYKINLFFPLPLWACHVFSTRTMWPWPITTRRTFVNNSLCIDWLIEPGDSTYVCTSYSSNIIIYWRIQIKFQTNERGAAASAKQSKHSKAQHILIRWSQNVCIDKHEPECSRFNRIAMRCILQLVYTRVRIARWIN